MKQLTILGSTGSIGCSTLDVVRHNPDSFRVIALVAGKNVARMAEQCLEFSPRYAVMDDTSSAEQLQNNASAAWQPHRGSERSAGCL